MAVVNSATVVFGAKMAIIDENLNVYKLADSELILFSSSMMLLTPRRIQNTSNEAWKQAKSKKRQKSADLVVLRLSQREKIEKSHFLEEEAIFFKILSTAFFST